MNHEIATFVEILTIETDCAHIAAAAESLLNSAASLDGPPPRQLISALIECGPATDQSLLNLARAWSRPEMSRAMLDELRGASTPGQKEQAAWLLKTVLASEQSREAIEQVLDKDEDGQVRRWLLEGLERITFGGGLGWNELTEVVSSLAGEPHPALRAGLASLLTALPWRPENAALLEPLLLDENQEVVSAAVHTLARHREAAQAVDPEILARLRVHASPIIRESATVLDESIRSADGTRR